MPEMKIDGNNITIIEDNTEIVKMAIKRQIENGMDAIGQACEDYAKLKCPVGTPESTGIPGYQGGTLRGSITHAVSSDGKTVVVSTNVKYAPYVELGTKKMDARPFLRPAANDHADEYRKILKNALSI